MHLFGFIDEYPHRKSLANRLCNVSQSSKIAKNIVVMPLGFKAEEKIQYFGETWFKTNTCDKAGGIAYKPVKETTNMELLDLPVPDLYMAWLQQAITD